MFVEGRLEDTQAGRQAAFSHVGFFGKEKLLFLAEAAVNEQRSWQQKKKRHWGRNQLKIPLDHILFKDSSLTLVSDNNGDDNDL